MKFLALPLLSLACVASLSAADAKWDGPYAGLSLGRTSFSGTVSSDENLPGNLSTGRKVAGNFGVIFGSNTQHKNVVTGYEVDFGTARGTASLVDSNMDASEITVQMKTQGHLRARFGYAFGSVLPYVGLGLACARVESRIEEDGTVDKDTQIVLGTSLALGVEYAVRPELKVRCEMVSDRYASAPVQSYDAAADSFNVKLNATTVKLGVTYSF